MESTPQTFKEKLDDCLNLDPSINFEELCQKWENLLAAFPDRPIVRIKYSHFLANRNRIEKAIPVLTANRELYNEHKSLQIRHINLLFKLHQWDPALANIELLIESDPTNSLYIFKKLQALIQQKKLKIANQFIQDNSGNLTKQHLINALYRLKKFEKINDIIDQETNEPQSKLDVHYEKAKIKLYYKNDSHTINTLLHESCQRLDNQNDQLKFLKRLMRDIPHSHSTINQFIHENGLQATQTETTYHVAQDEEFKPVKSREIDIVFTWTDSNETLFRNKFNEQNGFDVALDQDNQKNENRYQANGEIQFSLLCIQKFFPAVRNIFIVTNNQSFDTSFLNDVMENKIKFINQNDILIKSFVPKDVFNSTIIESFLWNIPGLSECFLYFCDDYFLGKPLDPTIDVFNKDGVPYCAVHHTNFNRVQFVQHLSPAQKSKKVYPEAFLFNAIREFERVYKLTPDLMHNHQAMILSRPACEKAFHIFCKDWQKNFFHDLVRSNESIHTLLLFNWVSLYHKYQVLDQSVTNDYMTFHNGFNESNRKYLIENRFQYFCLNDLSDHRSQEEFAKFQKEYLD